MLEPAIFQAEFKRVVAARGWGATKGEKWEHQRQAYYDYLRNKLSDERFMAAIGKAFAECDRLPKPADLVRMAPPSTRALMAPKERSLEDAEREHRDWLRFVQERRPNALARIGGLPPEVDGRCHRRLDFWYYYLIVATHLAGDDVEALALVERLQAKLSAAGWTPGDRDFPAPYIGPAGLAHAEVLSRVDVAPPRRRAQ